MRIEENRLLGPLTTFGIGGPARWLAEARSEAEITEAVAWAREQSAAVFVLGGGSNLLVADKGFDGLVIRVVLDGIEAVEEKAGQVLFEAGAGVGWDEFVSFATKADCAGIEGLAGIPGTVGGTPVQNVGAYGQEVATAIDSVRAFDLLEAKWVEFSAAECGFAYRCSRFNSTERGRYVVSRVRYRLVRGGAPTVRYPDLQRALAGRCAPSLHEVAEVVREVRQGKGMLVGEVDPDSKSAGSFFKNPVVEAEAVRRVAEAAGLEPPHYPAEPGKVKLSAAWLIEQAGFPKGYALGRAAVSSRHTLALVNRDHATAAEVLLLAEKIVSGVEGRFGVRLEMEPVRVGF